MSQSKSNLLVLPLLMFGKNDSQWHEIGEPVKERYIKEYTVFKTGKRAGQKKPVYDWRIKLVKRKTIVGYNGVFTRGKNKGEPKPIYETREVPVPSTGFFPSVNHIYLNGKFRGGGGRRLKPIAEEHLFKWKDIATKWKEENNWITQKGPTKVAIDLIFYLPSGQKDTHNAKKLLLDALEGVIHENDYFLLDRTLDFGIDDDCPRIEMNIYIPNETIPLTK